MHDAARPFATPELVTRRAGGAGRGRRGGARSARHRHRQARAARGRWRRRSTAPSWWRCRRRRPSAPTRCARAYAQPADGAGGGHRLRIAGGGERRPVAVVEGEPAQPQGDHTATDLAEAASPVLTDYHMHLVRRRPALRRRQLHARARRPLRRRPPPAAGIDEIGFTDHVYRFRRGPRLVRPSRSGRPMPSGDLRPLPRRRLGGARRRPAGEGGARGRLPGAAASSRSGEVVARFDWDYLLGSVHWVAGLAVDWELAPIWERYPADEVWRLYCDALCAGGGERHLRLDGPPRPGQGVRAAAGPEPQALYRADRRRLPGGRRLRRGVDRRAIGRALDELYPDPELLAMLHERGVPVTLGSDAHAPERVGRDFDRGRWRELRAAGYRTLTVFDRPRTAAGGVRWLTTAGGDRLRRARVRGRAAAGAGRRRDPARRGGWPGTRMPT